RGISASASRDVPHPTRPCGWGAARLRNHEGCGSTLRGHRAAGAGDPLWSVETAAGNGPGNGKWRAGRPGEGRRATPLLPADATWSVSGTGGGAAAGRDGACGAAQEPDRGQARMSPAVAERIYCFLLRAYPPAFRAEYGREMVLLFRDLCQESDVHSVGFWARVLGDVARSAPALRLDAWLTRWSENTRTMEVIMKLAAMLTVLLGVIGVLNAGVEWGAGAAQTIQGAHAVS